MDEREKGRLKRLLRRAIDGSPVFFAFHPGASGEDEPKLALSAARRPLGPVHEWAVQGLKKDRLVEGFITKGPEGLLFHCRKKPFGGDAIFKLKLRKLGLPELLGLEVTVEPTLKLSHLPRKDGTDVPDLDPGFLKMELADMERKKSQFLANYKAASSLKDTLESGMDAWLRGQKDALKTSQDARQVVTGLEEARKALKDLWMDWRDVEEDLPTAQAIADMEYTETEARRRVEKGELDLGNLDKRARDVRENLAKVKDTMGDLGDLDLEGQDDDDPDLSPSKKTPADPLLKPVREIQKDLAKALKQQDVDGSDLQKKAKELEALLKKADPKSPLKAPMETLVEALKKDPKDASELKKMAQATTDLGKKVGLAGRVQTSRSPKGTSRTAKDKFEKGTLEITRRVRKLANTKEKNPKEVQTLKQAVARFYKMAKAQKSPSLPAIVKLMGELEEISPPPPVPDKGPGEKELKDAETAAQKAIDAVSTYLNGKTQKTVVSPTATGRLANMARKSLGVQKINSVVGMKKAIQEKLKPDAAPKRVDAHPFEVRLNMVKASLDTARRQARLAPDNALFRYKEIEEKAQGLLADAQRKLGK